MENDGEYININSWRLSIPIPHEATGTAFHIPPRNGDFPDTLVLELESDAGELVVQLVKDLSFLGGSVLLERNDGSSTFEDCNYSGRVAGLLGSTAAVNVCDGEINGYIRPDSERYFVLHSSQTESGRSVSLWTPRHSANNATRSIAALHRSKRSAPEQRSYPDYYADYIDGKTRWVELVLVHDQSQWKRFARDRSRIVSRSKQIVNIINSLYHPLNIKFALVHVDIWTRENQIAITTDGEVTLSNFLFYRKKVLLNPADTSRYIRNDNAQLLTDVVFQNGVVGKALRGPMCSYEHSGGVNVDHSDNVVLVATTVAHEIGHNLGMEHDKDSCQCPDTRCIMSSATGGGFPPGFWSSCSLEYLAWALSHGADYCMRDRPASLADAPTCGNGIAEEGEQCDCGLPEVCDNICCDPHTCLLKGEAMCGAGDCCDLQSCQIKAKSASCRVAKSECDLPEYCDGQSNFCPNDYHKANGESCQNRLAHCYDGQCRTHDDQCRLLWGETGRASEQPCFDLNTRGDVYGNCGYDRPKDQHNKCAVDDTSCGMLHCVHRNERSEFGDKSIVITAHTFIPRRRIGGSDDPIICRSALVDLGLSDPDPGLVPNGARCGADKMCVDQKCVPVQSVKQLTKCDPPDCSGNGVCNDAGYCHCNPGYGWPFCIGSGTGGSEVSGPAPSPSGKFSVTAGVLIFLLLVVPLVTILVTLWHRRRKRLQKAGGGGPSKATSRRRARGSRHSNATQSFLHRLIDLLKPSHNVLSAASTTTAARPGTAKLQSTRNQDSGNHDPPPPYSSVVPHDTPMTIDTTMGALATSPVIPSQPSPQFLFDGRKLSSLNEINKSAAWRAGGVLASSSVCGNSSGIEQSVTNVDDYPPPDPSPTPGFRLLPGGGKGRNVGNGPVSSTIVRSNTTAGARASSSTGSGLHRPPPLPPNSMLKSAKPVISNPIAHQSASERVVDGYDSSSGLTRTPSQRPVKPAPPRPKRPTMEELAQSGVLKGSVENVGLAEDPKSSIDSISKSFSTLPCRSSKREASKNMGGDGENSGANSATSGRPGKIQPNRARGQGVRRSSSSAERPNHRPPPPPPTKSVKGGTTSGSYATAPSGSSTDDGGPSLISTAGSAIPPPMHKSVAGVARGKPPPLSGTYGVPKSQTNKSISNNLGNLSQDNKITPAVTKPLSFRNNNSKPGTTITNVNSNSNNRLDNDVPAYHSPAPTSPVQDDQEIYDVIPEQGLAGEVAGVAKKSSQGLGSVDCSSSVASNLYDEMAAEFHRKQKERGLSVEKSPPCAVKQREDDNNTMYDVPSDVIGGSLSTSSSDVATKSNFPQARRLVVKPVVKSSVSLNSKNNRPKISGPILESGSLKQPLPPKPSLLKAKPAVSKPSTSASIIRPINAGGNSKFNVLKKQNDQSLNRSDSSVSKIVAQFDKNKDGSD